jgi:LysR family transcriptional regulator, glycine cleavage system transcriptional activator
VLFVVCAPRFAASITTPQDVSKFPLLHTDSRGDWDAWLTAAQVDPATMQRGPVFNRVSLAIDAAIDGQGLALSRTTLAAWDILKGRLSAPLPIRLPLSKSYWLVCPVSKGKVPKIRKFREWLKQEADNDLRLLRATSVIGE